MPAVGLDYDNTAVASWWRNVVATLKFAVMLRRTFRLAVVSLVWIFLGYWYCAPARTIRSTLIMPKLGGLTY